MALPFIAPSRAGDAWFCVGPISSFPDITDSGAESLYEPKPCQREDSSAPGCKVFHVPPKDSSQAQQIEGEDMITHDGAALQDQVLVFRYKGKVHAIDNRCPHSSFPLSKGIPFDIEDFGIALSAGITCPKHGWSFDLFSGRADRSNYMLRRWEVQIRPPSGSEVQRNSGVVGGPAGGDEQEVWVRRKQRIG
ncbi:hypothetical protein F4780DRAFT_322649 [Xylariomycetidae sp. FL0641]|nr:hypothetical protein F4780DRAFT_322649 [Xylariomycetidae sp. FL0641]